MSDGGRLGRHLRDATIALRGGPDARSALRRRYQYDVLRHLVSTVGVQTRDGMLFVPTADRTVGRSVYVNGGWEPDLLDRALAAATSGSVFVEVGANIGTTTLAAARHVDRVVAVEPAPENVALLRATVAANALGERVTIVQAGCSDSDRDGGLSLNAVNWGDHRVSDEGATPIRLRTLDGILRESGVAPADIRLLWVDTQGHEAQVLAGATETLAARPPMLMEFWPPVLGESVGDVLEVVSGYSRVTDMADGSLVADVGALADRYEHGSTDLLLL